MHLGELQLGLGAHATWEGCVADDVSQRLPFGSCQLSIAQEIGVLARNASWERIPQGLILGKDLAAGVITNDARIGEAANVEPLGAERS